MEQKLLRSLHKRSTTSRFHIFLLSLTYLILPGYMLGIGSTLDSVSAEDILGASAVANSESVRTPLMPSRPNSYPFAFNSVTIEADGEEIKLFTESKSVEQVLAAAQISYDSDDKISPSLTHTVGNGAKILVVRVQSENEEVISEIPFETQYEEDASMFIGENRVVQYGINGTLKEEYLLTYENGEVVNKAKVNEIVVSEPVNQIVAKGVKALPVATFSGNNSCTYWDGKIENLTSNKTEQAWLKHVMRCESSCNAQSVSPYGHYGLFQFSPTTFKGYGGKDIFNGEEQLNIVLSMYRIGKKSAFGCSY